jgi:hypothetical protein
LVTEFLRLGRKLLHLFLLELFFQNLKPVSCAQDCQLTDTF